MALRGSPLVYWGISGTGQYKQQQDWVQGWSFIVQRNRASLLWSYDRTCPHAITYKNTCGDMWWCNLTCWYMPPRAFTLTHTEEYRTYRTMGWGLAAVEGRYSEKPLEIMIWRHRNLKLQWSSLLVALIFNCNVKFYFWGTVCKRLKVNRRQVEDKWRETNKESQQGKRGRNGPTGRHTHTHTIDNWGRSRWQGRKNDISVVLIRYPSIIPFQNFAWKSFTFSGNGRPESMTPRPGRLNSHWF